MTHEDRVEYFKYINYNYLRMWDLEMVCWNIYLINKYGKRFNIQRNSIND